MRLSVRPAEPNELPRVLELATRANRLSSTGLALDDGLLSRYAADGRVFVGGLTDRFGDDGLVAIALLAPTSRPVDEVPAAWPSTADPGGLRVELLSVSCRVAGRGVAEAFVAELTALADAADGRGLTIPIRATGPTPNCECSCAAWDSTSWRSARTCSKRAARAGGSKPRLDRRRLARR